MRSFSHMGRCSIKYAALTFLVVLAGSMVVYGQVPECPRPAMAHLAHLAGAWTVTLDYRLEGALTRADSAYAEIEMAANNCALVKKVQASVRGQSLAIAKILAAPTAETLQQGYVDSFHGGLSVAQGYVRGDTIRFERSRDWGTHIQLVQHEYLDIEANTFKTEARMSPDNGETWILTQRATYHRRR